MPFDTTYFINTYDENISGSITFPGGKDIAIELEPWQLPSELDTALARHDPAVRKFQNSLAKEKEDAKSFTPDPGFVAFFVVVFAMIIYKTWKSSADDNSYSQTIFPGRKKKRTKTFKTYYGNALGFSDLQLIAILTKRFPFYKQLSQSQQIVFVERLQKFLANKIFKIHGEKGFKEIPVATF